MKQAHRSDPQILGRRTLANDHRQLAAILRPGLSVLDVGCGTGAITVGIAETVGPRGFVLGVDRDEALIQMARQQHAAIPNLQFEVGDITALNYRDRFDIVTAARTLQWISEPGQAILKMSEAAKTGGMVVVLDYNHAANEWEPRPPAEFMVFYQAFLEWRQANQWDNRMAGHLPDLFAAAGLVDVASYRQDEVVERGDPAFGERTALWPEVIGNIGEHLIQAGFCSQAAIELARQCYESWRKTDLLRQTLSMRAVIGVTNRNVASSVAVFEKDALA